MLFKLCDKYLMRNENAVQKLREMLENKPSRTCLSPRRIPGWFSEFWRLPQSKVACTSFLAQFIFRDT